MSYQAAKKGAARKPRSLGRREWLVPSNTKYCDMERLFDRFILLDHGRIALDGQSDDLREQYGCSIAELMRRKL